MIALAAIPLLVFGAHALSRPARAIAPTPVVTEGVRVIRLDANTFRGRWSPVNDLAPATVIHEVGGGDAANLRAASKPVDVAASAPRPPARLVRRASLRPTDLCARHGLRRVSYSVRGYQHWRCRR
jgi:hypothetical protein